ncbi:MAG TPA: ABC transporter permease [Mesotoga sp.]|nr:ABC transporter permease [Mesotoga sp.]
MIELLNHIKIIAIAVPIAIGIGVPIGIIVSRNKKVSSIALYGAGILMTIPSLALFGYMVVLLAPLKAGIGVTPAVIALVIYSFLPVIRNTVVAVNSVDPRMIEAAKGMGMTNRQILWKVEMPVTVPTMLSGIRSSATINIGTAAIAASIGAGGLGEIIFTGLRMTRGPMIIAGAIPVTLLAVAVDIILGFSEKALTSKGLRT